MPFNPQPALQGLRNTTFMPRPGTELLTPEEMAPNPPLSPGGSPIPKDPASIVHLFKDRFKSSLKDRLFAAQRTGDVNEERALQGLIGSTEQDIATDPITEQKVQSDITGKANQEAVLRGFYGGAGQIPAQAHQKYLQQQEEAKLRMPATVESIKEAGALERQKETSRGALAVTESKSGQAQNFMDMMMNRGEGVKGFTVPGGGGSVSFNQPGQIPPGLLHDITLARQAVERAGPTKSWWFGGGASPEKIALDQSIENALLRHPAPTNLKEFAHQVSKDPRTAKLGLPDILRMTGENQLSSEEQSMLQDLLSIIRGF